jgi:hypothetical protein
MCAPRFRRIALTANNSDRKCGIRPREDSAVSSAPLLLARPRPPSRGAAAWGSRSVAALRPIDRHSLVLIAGYLIANGTPIGQSGDDLRRKYGEPSSETFVVRPGVEVTATYAANRRVTELPLDRPWDIRRPHQVAKKRVEPRLRIVDNTGVIFFLAYQSLKAIHRQIPITAATRSLFPP